MFYQGYGMQICYEKAYLLIKMVPITQLFDIFVQQNMDIANINDLTC